MGYDVYKYQNGHWHLACTQVETKKEAMMMAKWIALKEKLTTKVVEAQP